MPLMRSADGPIIHDPAMFIDIPLTGERTYVHGADIFDALIAATGAEQAIRLSLKTAGDCAMELLEEGRAPAGIEPCGRFRFARDGSTVRHVLLRRLDRPSSARMPMSDDAQSGTFMQRLSARSVAVLARDFPGDYWSIAEITCRRLPQGDATADVAIGASVGNRFWKVVASADGVPMGHIIMARGQPRR